MTDCRHSLKQSGLVTAGLSLAGADSIIAAPKAAFEMMKIVSAGYQGWVGIEYEGSKLSGMDGIRATRKLLEKVRPQMMAK